MGRGFSDLEALAQNLERLSVDANLTRLSAEHITLDAHKVTYVEQLLENHVIEVFVLVGAQVVAADVHLNSST